MQPLIVTAAVVVHDGRILITRRPPGVRQGGLWELPGGKLEDGESPAEALRRELLEELALPVEVGLIYDVVFHHYDWGPVLLLAFRCRPEHLAVQNLQVAEHRWVRPEELAGFSFLPADDPLIERLASES